MKSPYRSEETGTFYNKLGIHDNKALQVAEYDIAYARDAELRANPIKGKYDLDHLKRIHSHLFGDVYEWAGKPRTVFISKRDGLNHWKTTFAPPEQFEQIGASVAGDVKRWNSLKGAEKVEFVARITALHVKLNYMHPFPDGNGRATRTMLSQIAKAAGYDLDYAKVSPERWNDASARAMPQTNVREPVMTRKPDITPLQQIFDKIATPIQERQRSTGRGPER